MRNIQSLIILFFLAITITSFGQKKKKNRFPISTFHKDSINIHGISIGLWSLGETRHTNTNGIKFELIGVGIFVPLMPKSPIVKTDSAFIQIKKEPLSEKINGLNLSATGTSCHCLTNGVTIGFSGQINFQVNGISTSIFMNFTQKHNGVMIAMTNEAYYMNGLQIGYFNGGFKTKGIQIGLFQNSAKNMKGIQVGLVNKSENLKGFQFGLWNTNGRRSLPFINWQFKPKRKKD